MAFSGKLDVKSIKKATKIEIRIPDLDSDLTRAEN